MGVADMRLSCQVIPKLKYMYLNTAISLKTV